MARGFKSHLFRHIRFLSNCGQCVRLKSEIIRFDPERNHHVYIYENVINTETEFIGIYMGKPIDRRYFGVLEKAGPQIVGAAYFSGGADWAYILKQSSSSKFVVHKYDDPNQKMKASLVDSAPATFGDFVILVAPFGEGPQYARKITSRKVYLFDGRVLKWSTDPAQNATECDVFISGEYPTLAEATANIVNGEIDTITVNVNGHGYYNPPLVLILGDGNGATAEAVLSTGDDVLTINVISGGSGYTYANVVITPP